MASARKILVVDDDPHIREVVRFALRKAGFETVEASDGERALVAVTEHAPDLVVLDVVMPELDGTEVCRAIRKTSALPIVFLTSRDDEIDRIVGLELGGDDYVTKPFSPRELVARVRAVLRRVQPAPESAPSTPLAPPTSAAPPSAEVDAPEVRSHGRLSLDAERFVASWDGAEVVLTVTEFQLLAALLGRPGKVYTRDDLMTRAYGQGVVVSDRTIDSHIKRVRKKFQAVGGDPVETVHGLGYRLGAC
jgi:two-component system OmpR family response regulator